MFGLPKLLAPPSEICGAVYLPQRTGARGDPLNPIVCTGRPPLGAPLGANHRGKHRTTLPGGARLRWTDKETQK